MQNKLEEIKFSYKILEVRIFPPENVYPSGL